MLFSWIIALHFSKNQLATNLRTAAASKPVLPCALLPVRSTNDCSGWLEVCYFDQRNKR